MSGLGWAAFRGGRWCPGRLIAGALLWARLVPSQGELYDGVVRGSYNMLAEAAYAVGLSHKANIGVDAPCQLDEGSSFVAGIPGNDRYTADLNSFRCMYSAFDLSLELNCTGTCFYAYEGDPLKWVKYGWSIPLDVPAEESQWLYIKACEDDPCKAGTAAYTQLSFYKSGSDAARVTDIKVTYDDPHEGKLMLKPTFGPSFSSATLNYKLQLRQDKDFNIQIVWQSGYTVGFEWIDWQGQLGDTWVEANGEFSSCRDLTDPLCDDRENLKCQSADSDDSHHTKNFSLKGFSTPREGGVISVCGYGKDAYSSLTNYTITIEVVKVYSKLLEVISYSYDEAGGEKVRMYPLHESERTHFKDGTFDPNILEWEILLPDVGKHKRWAVERNGDPPFVITAIAEENTKSAKAKIKICPAEDAECTQKVEEDGKASFELYMPDNENRHLNRDAPEWERTLVIDVTAPDNLEHHNQYRVRIKQDVSHTAVLSNIDFLDMGCSKELGSMTEFDPDVKDYSCVWSWEEFPDAEYAMMAPAFDEGKCPDCEIEVLNQHNLITEDTLYMDFLDIKFQQDPYWWSYGFPSGKQWKHRFLLGEDHVIPIYVVAADHMTKREYRVKFLYECPYAISASFTRRVSTFVAWLAFIMAVGSAGNVMALSKQIQFMILSTLVEDSPDTYKQFAKAKSLKIFTGDLDALLDVPPFSWIDIPSKDWFEQQFEHNFVKVGNSMMTGEVVTQISKYCAVRELFGETKKEQDTHEARLATGALLCFDHISWPVIIGDLEDYKAWFKAGNTIENLSPLDKLYWKVVNLTEEQTDEIDDRIRDCEIFTQVEEEENFDYDRRLVGITLEKPNITGRRLSQEDLLDEFDDDDDAGSVFFWDLDEVQNVAEKASIHIAQHVDDGENLKFDTFPDFADLCYAEQIEDVMFGVHLYQKFNTLYDSMTGRAGTFLGISFTVIIGGLLYYIYYLLFIRGVQYRLNFLEPGNLILFMANVLYIPYAMKTGKLAFTGMEQVDDEEENTQKDIDFLIGTLDSDHFYIMWISCWVGLIVFPIAFVIGFTYYIHRNTSNHNLLWHSDFGLSCWADPTCIAAKLPRVPWLKKKIPILPGLLNRYVRMCIPILTKSGEPLVSQKLKELEGNSSSTESAAEVVHSESDAESAPPTPSEADSPGGNGAAVQARLKHSMQKSREQEEHRLAKEQRWASQKSKLEQLLSNTKGKHEQLTEGDFSTYAPWMPWENSLPDEDGKTVRQPDEYVRPMGLFNLVKSWEMRKGHHDGFKLDDEETFAMQQFLDVLVKQEERLLAYNILKIVPQDGCLKPSEPKKKNTRVSTVSNESAIRDEPFWLNSKEDYFDDDSVDLNGRHKDLEEFGVAGTDHISNSFGERLVYQEPGRFSARPLAHRYGNLTWLKEPDQGWKKWEEQNTPHEPTSKVRYADKWQWLSFEHWSAPWNVDDISELEWEIKCCGRVLHTFNPSEAVGSRFFMKVRKAYLQQYRNMVQHHVPLAEKVEMRKWVYCKLMRCMDMKLKAVYFASQHPDYAKEKLMTLEEMARKDFHSSLREIYTATPTNGRVNQQPFNLINYTIMRIEDTYEEEEEPWWQACDPVLDGEIKVQFDHPVFWQRWDGVIKPKELFNHKSTSEMVPKNGYWSSEYIDQVKDASVGMKRYMLTKPDGSSTQVSVEVELEHVPSLMSYTNKFKVSMPFESLELQYRQQCEILICEMGPGEQYNFGVEGLTLVLSVVVLSAQTVIDSAFSGFQTSEGTQLFAAGSFICAFAFFLAKGGAFTFGMSRSMYGSKDSYEDAEEEAKTLVSVKSTNDIDQSAQTLSNIKKEDDEPEGEAAEDTFFNRAVEAIQKPDIITLLLQTLLLFIILLALFTTRREYLGIVCIFIATLAMICVGIFATLPALRQILEEQAQNIEKMWDIIRHALYTGGVFCQRCCYRVSRNSTSLGGLASYAKNITLTVTELGLTFNGDIDVDQEASLEDQLKSQIRKKLVYKIVHDDDFEDDEDGGPSNLRSDIKRHARFQDVQDSISIAFTVDQMMMSQSIPPIVACVQCINHTDSAKDICNPKFDNYLTLFRPHGWQTEFDSNQAKLDEMHQGFKDEIDAWFRNTLGAVETQRTYTTEIKGQLMQAILDDSKGGARNLLKVRLRHISLPKGNVSFKAKLDKQLLYVTILTEAAPLVPRTPEAFPLDRMSGYFRVNEIDETYQCDTPVKDDDSCDNKHDMESSEIMLALTGETTKFRLCVWAQTGNVDELVGFSPPVDLKHRLEKEEGVLQTRPVCCSWDPTLDDDLKQKVDAPVGRIEFQVLQPTDEQKERDLSARVNLKALTSGSGDSELTTEKIARYADLWPVISLNLGVRLARRHLPVLRERLGRMQQLREDMNWSRDDEAHVKQRMDAFLKEGIRRAVGTSRAEIDTAIRRLEEGIADEEARMAAEERRLQATGAEDGESDSLVMSLPTEVYRIGAREINGVFGLHTSLRGAASRPQTSTSGTGTASDNGPNAYETELASRIRQVLVTEENVGAQMIHYVLMSNHIKPNKNWRPDALSPHVAKLVSNEIDDIPAVALTGLPQGRIRFARVEDASGKPELRNGRLCFRCDTNIFDALEASTDKATPRRTKDKVYLYWSGRGCWVISEKKGEPQPGIIRKVADRRFFWVKDPSATPDLVEVPWNKATLKPGGWDWEVDRDIKINKSLGKASEEQRGRKGANFQETLGEITKLFFGQDRKRLDPDLKDCLISMNSNYLNISWKDHRGESLIPFRKYLLDTSGSYNKAWELFTSAKSVYKNTCVANLANMFADTAALLIKGQGSTKPARGTNKWLATKEKSKADTADATIRKFLQTYNTGAKLRKLADDVVHAMDVGGSAGESEGDGSIGILEVERVYDVVGWQKNHKKNKDMLAFCDWVHAHPSYKSIENFWADLTEGDGIDKNDFFRVVKPQDWQYIRDYMVSIGQEKKIDAKDCERMANSLFKTLDAQQSGTVSLNELRPTTGNQVTDIDRILLKFSIPLTHIAEIRIQTNQQASAKLQKRLRISIKTQFEEVEEPFSDDKRAEGVEHMKGWGAFRKAVDPDWQPVPNREYIEFSMSENFFKLWDTVIDESDMRRPQEWVQNYDGEHIDHPRLNGNYLRHGRGAQRWGNGTYYDGEWSNHLYSGRGRLYAKYEDYAAALNPPIFDGNWENGKRQGFGELRWQQAINDSTNAQKSAFRQRGISKIYQGNFKDDLFHGEGVLTLAKAPTGQVAAPGQDQRTLGTYPPYSVDPIKLLEFKGQFESDYVDTYLWIKQRDPDWNLEAEENERVEMPQESVEGNKKPTKNRQGMFGSSMKIFKPKHEMFDWEKEQDEVKRRQKAEDCKDLMLHKITPQMKKAGSARYMHFFEYISESTQRSGPPLTDLAMRVYGIRGGDAIHFKHGAASFASPAPGTTYVGDWLRGQPHGKGVMTHLPITYDGQWEASLWHGDGLLSHEDGYSYKGQWVQNHRHGHGLQVNAGKVARQYGYHAYRGSWVDDQRHGKGEMMFSMDEKSEQKFLHEGVFENGLREGKCELYFLVPSKKKTQLGDLANKLTRTSYSIDSYEYTNPNPTSAVSRSTPRNTQNNNSNKGKEPTSPRRTSMESYYKLLYFSGWFENDNMPKHRKSWLHLVNPLDDVFVGNWYFGQVTEDGTRQGDGSIYAAEAGDDPAFMQCVMSGKPYIKERLVCETCRAKDSSTLCCPHKGLDRHHLKFLVYDGQWHQNLPHGIGVQFYPEVAKGVGGVYYGDFKDGARHGRGTWQVRDRSFIYMPLPKKKGVHNWKEDMMHGVANVEDSKYVHDNVVYADNRTMMPFTSVGPPQTKFDSVAGWNVVFKGVRVVSHTRAKVEARAATPSKSMAARKGSKAKIRRRGSVSSKGSSDGHWHDDDTKVLQKVVKHNGKLSAEQFKGKGENDEFDLIREPTELLQHEEDMLVLGGTGENTVMNGLYFKVSKSFGHSLWRMVKQETGPMGLWSKCHQRYIFKEDTKRGRTWYIAPHAFQGLQREAGCAAGDEILAHEATVNEGGPHCVRGQWMIWSSTDHTMVKPKDIDVDADDKAKQGIDVLSVEAIVGFTVQDERLPDLDGRLFVRQSGEFYDRPLYANEAGLPEESTLYLYWFKQGGSSREGHDFSNDTNIRDTDDPNEFFQPGCWVVSSKMGAGPTSFYGDREDADFIIAYIGEKCATPYDIAPGARWWMKDESLGIWTLRTLGLRRHILENNDEMMDFFESSDEEEDYDD